MKKITILIGFVLWSLSGQACAEIAIIAPFSDDNCDQIFGNKAMLPNPGWNDSKHIDLMAVLMRVVTMKAVENSASSGFQQIDGNMSENNLFCFPVPKVIMAKGAPYRQNFLVTVITVDLARERLFLTANEAMCCYVHYPLARQLVTT